MKTIILFLVLERFYCEAFNPAYISQHIIPASSKAERCDTPSRHFSCLELMTTAPAATFQPTTSRHSAAAKSNNINRTIRRAHEIGNNIEEPISHANKLDIVLGRLTNLFPAFVLAFAVIGAKFPSTLNWVSTAANGNLVTIFLAAVMAGTGMSLEKSDFASIFENKQSASVIPVGVLCQFGIMPASAWLVSKILILQGGSAEISSRSAALFLGLTLVGCSPGGTASNLVSLIAGADVALSVLLTACSTILASLLTPLLVKLLVAGTVVDISGMALCIATAKVVLAPVALGVFLNERAPALSKRLSRFTPFASVVLVSLICGGVVAQNATAGMLSAFDLRLLTSVVSLHSLGFFVGFFIPRLLFGYSTKTCRTISIETGMQNSALAVVLARSIGADPLASLPGALSATAHSCIGSLLAAIWRLQDRMTKENKES